MGNQRVYASLAIYDKSGQQHGVTESLGILPSFEEHRKGVYTWSVSTLGTLDSQNVEDHVSHIAQLFIDKRDGIKEILKMGCDIRLWIYFRISGTNSAFILTEDLVLWLSEMKADICVDIWT